MAQALPRNASLKVAGRLDAGESESYRFLTFPPFATNKDEAAPDEEADERKADEIAERMGAYGGRDPDLRL